MFWCRAFFFFSSRRRHTRCSRDWSSDVCSSDLVIARLKAGTSVPQAQAEMSAVAWRLEKQYPGPNSNTGVFVVPELDELVGGSRSTLLVLLGAVVFVMLIACANVANLLLARARTRQREI